MPVAISILGIRRRKGYPSSALGIISKLLDMEDR